MVKIYIKKGLIIMKMFGCKFIKIIPNAQIRGQAEIPSCPFLKMVDSLGVNHFQNETILAMVKGVDFLSSSEIIPETTVSS